MLYQLGMGIFEKEITVYSEEFLAKVGVVVVYTDDVRGVQGVQLHPSIFDKDLNCTHQF